MTIDQIPKFLFALEATTNQFDTARFVPYVIAEYPNPKRGEMMLDGYVTRVYGMYLGKFQLWNNSLELPPPEQFS